jgi:hypothetical protein
VRNEVAGQPGQDDERIADEVAAPLSAAIEDSGIDFVASDVVEDAVRQADLDDATTEAIVDDYEQAQLQALKAGLLVAGFLALVALAFTGDLPHERPASRQDTPVGDAVVS